MPQLQSPGKWGFLLTSLERAFILWAMEIRGPSQGYGRPIRMNESAVQGSCPGTRSPVSHPRRGQGGMRPFGDTADPCGSMRPPVRTKEVGAVLRFLAWEVVVAVIWFGGFLVGRVSKGES